MQTLPTREAYDLWSETYPPIAHNPLMHAEQAVVMRRLATIRASRALDVGTGSGRYAPLLEATGARTVIGADLSLGMLRRNDSRYRVCADARHLPLPSGCMDLINASLIAGDIDDVTAWIAELARVLAPGGHLLYSDFHPSWSTRGWQRTFRTRDGEECALPRAAHEIDDHFVAIEHAGLEVIAADEVHVERSTLRFWRPREAPVAVVFYARKAVA